MKNSCMNYHAGKMRKEYRMKRFFYLIAVIMFIVLNFSCNLSSNNEFAQNLSTDEIIVEQDRCWNNPESINFSIINNVLKDLKNREINQIVKYLSSDIEWVVIGQPGTTPFAGDYTGKADVTHYLKQFYPAIKIHNIVVESIAETAPKIYETYIRIQGFIKSNHRTIDIQFLYTWQFNTEHKIDKVMVVYNVISLELAFSNGGKGHIVSDVSISQAAIDFTNSFLAIKNYVINLPYSDAKAVLYAPPVPPPIIPEDGELEVKDLNGVYGELISTPGNYDNKIILQIHGGSFIHGYATSLRPFAYKLAKLVNIPVLSIDYGLAIEEPFSAGLEDCFTAYKELLKQYKARNILLLGISAGGNLIFSVMEKALDASLPLPGAVVGFSPWLDLTNSGESMVYNNDSDTLLSKTWFDRAAGWYLTDSSSLPTDPLVSPLLGNVTGFPPTYLTVGSSEVLLNDSTRMFDVLSAENIDVTIEIAYNITHVYPIYNLPEADRTLARIAEFIKDKLHIK